MIFDNGSRRDHIVQTPATGVSKAIELAFSGEPPTDAKIVWDDNGHLTRAAREEGFKGKADQTFAFHTHGRLEATRVVLTEWIERLRRDTGEGFPEGVTAFRPEMAVHGRYGKPCPDCGAPVQRIVYAENETNYCARCQTGGRILADRALSRLLKKSWPRSIDELP